MIKEEMLPVLEEHHRAIRAGLKKIERHCGFPRPSSSELDADRADLSRVSLARSAFVRQVVVPALLENADAELRHDLAEVLLSFAAKRQISNAHIATWTSDTIEQDWDGYCAASYRIRGMMEEQLQTEWRVLAGLLMARS